MECPVCKTITTDPAQKKCPECATDLEIFQMLEMIEKQAGSRWKTVRSLIFLIVLVVALAVAGYYFLVDLNTNQLQSDRETIKKQQSEIQNLLDEKQILLSGIAELRQEVQTLNERITTLTSQAAAAPKGLQEAKPARPTTKEIVHVVKAGENLQRIARKYYGSNDEYVRIMKDNNITNANNIRPNQRLKIIVPVTD